MKLQLTPPLPTGYNLPDARLDMPELLTPGMKPVGPVKIDWSHPATQRLQWFFMPNATSLGSKNLFYKHGNMQVSDPTVAGALGIWATRIDKHGIYWGNTLPQKECYWTVGAGVRPVANKMTIWMDFVPITDTPSTASFLFGDVSISSTDYNWGLYHTTTNGITCYIKNASASAVAVGAGIMNIGERQVVVATYDGSKIYTARNGRYWDSAAQTGNVQTTSTFYFGHNHWNTNQTAQVRVISCGMSITALSIPQIVSMSADPYQFLLPA